MFPRTRFPSFSGHYTEKSLHDAVLELKSGLSRMFSDSDIGLPVIRSNNIKDYCLDFNELKYWFEEDPQGATTSKYHLRDGDILVNFINSQAQIGKSAIYYNALNRDCIYTTNIMSLRIKNEHSPEFIFFFFQTKKYDDYIQSIAKPAVNQASFTTKDFRKMKIFFPDLTEQTKIANFLCSVDEKIALLNKQYDLLCQYKKGMMQKIFSQEVRFKDENGEEFPEWNFISAGKLFENSSNKKHKGDLPILAVTQENGVVNRDSINIDIKSSQESINSYKIIDKGDFVISLRSFQGGIEHSPLQGLCSPAYTVLKNIKPIIDGFYRFYLKKDSFIEELSQTVVGIRDGKQISYKAFSILELPYPSLPEQKKISDFLFSLDDKIAVKKAEIDKLTTWKQGLLQQMFV